MSVVRELRRMVCWRSRCAPRSTASRTTKYPAQFLSDIAYMDSSPFNGIKRQTVDVTHSQPGEESIPLPYVN